MRQNCAKLSVKDQLPLPANTTASPQIPRLKDAFFWDYSLDSYSGIRITEHTGTDFVLFWKQNSWRDKNYGDVTEEVWVRNFPAERRAKTAKRSQLSAILSIPNKQLFRGDRERIQREEDSNRRLQVVSSVEWISTQSLQEAADQMATENRCLILIITRNTIFAVNREARVKGF